MKKKLFPILCVFFAAGLVFLLRPVSVWAQTVLGRAFGWPLLVLLTALALATVVSYMLPSGRVRSILHGIGEWFYPLFLTALPLLLIACAVYYAGVPVSPKTALLVFLAVYLPLIAAGLIAGLRLHTRRYTVPLPGTEPFRIVLLSDLHLGFFTPADLTGKIAEAVRREDPDLILIAGDFFDDRYDSLHRKETVAEGLKQLSAAAEVCACEGNHDLLTADASKDAFLVGAGIRLLKDEAFDFRGVRIFCRRDVKDPARLPAEKVLPGTEPLIVLDHSPEDYKAAWLNGAFLVLSGHTHGGQTFPGTLLYKWKKLARYGHISADGRHLIVTAGAGLYGCPVRLGAGAEIAVITVGGKE